MIKSKTPPARLLAISTTTSSLLFLHPLTLTTASGSLTRLPEKTQGTTKPGMLLAATRWILSVELSLNTILRVFSLSQLNFISLCDLILGGRGRGERELGAAAVLVYINANARTKISVNAANAILNYLSLRENSFS